MSAPLRLGLALGGAGDPASWERALALVERADRLGLHSVWLPEGHFQRGATPSPLVALAAFAARSQKLKLATTSVLLPLHPPETVAREVATLDVLSGGRVLLGLGRGFRSPVFEGFGQTASGKRDRFDESLDWMLAAWRGEEVSAAIGRGTAGLPGVLRLPIRPVQQPHPPLVVAAFGQKGLLQAAHRGLPYLASPLEPLDLLEENYATWEQELAKPPSADAPQRPVMRVVYAAADDDEARRVAEALEAETRPLRRNAPKALARAAAAPLAERALIGTSAAVADGIGRYRERLGMDLLVARCEGPGVPSEARDDALERLVGEVLPAL